MSDNSPAASTLNLFIWSLFLSLLVIKLVVPTAMSWAWVLAPIWIPFFLYWALAAALYLLEKRQ